MNTTEIFAIIIFCMYYVVFNHSHVLNEPISYAPYSTTMDTYIYKYMPILIAGIALCHYMVNRNPVLLFVPMLILVGFPLMGNPHFFNIDLNQYKNVRAILNTKPELIPIVPNYVNSKCEMTKSNYKQFTGLANSSNSTSFFTELPVRKTTDEVKKMCVSTIYKD